MSEAIRRNSKQRQLILDTLRSVHNHPTAEDVFQMVREKNPTISLGTVYRNLNLLVDNGDMQKDLVLEHQGLSVGISLIVYGQRWILFMMNLRKCGMQISRHDLIIYQILNTRISV